MTKRKNLSNKIRFEIFKRDDFTCQYCGEHPPQIILHVDHINPVKNGGDNSTDNLVTACNTCNSGKSAELLVIEEKMDELTEKLDKDLKKKKKTKKGNPKKDEDEDEER